MAQRTRAVESAGKASTVAEVEVALARMQIAPPPPAVAAAIAKGRRNSVSVDEWTIEKSKLVSKLMCLKGTTAYKFARDKIMKKKWQNPALKTLLSPAKGFIVWTGRKPVRFTKVPKPPSNKTLKPL